MRVIIKCQQILFVNLEAVDNGMRVGAAGTISGPMKKNCRTEKFRNTAATKASGSPGKEGDLPALVNGVPEQGIPI